MKMKTAIRALAATVAAFSATQAFAACEDDPRMYTMADFAEAKEAGEEVEPMELTPATYLHLSEKARDVIGDDAVLLDSECEPVQLLDGQPPTKIEVPFSTLYSSFHDALLRGDEHTLNILLGGFKAQPVDPTEFLSLISVITPDQDMTKRLASIAGINPHQVMNVRNCDDSVLLTYADLFNRFGGRVEGRNGRAWVIVGEHSDIYTPDDHNISKYSSLPGKLCGVQPSHALQIARNTGAITFYHDGWIKNSTEDWHEHYESWVDKGASAEEATSLLD